MIPVLQNSKRKNSKVSMRKYELKSNVLIRKVSNRPKSDIIVTHHDMVIIY